jgi:glycosyltransferase involved in cell wall biosynthesis
MGLLRSAGHQTSILIKSDNGPLASELSDASDASMIYSNKEESVVQYCRRKIFRATGLGFGRVFDGAGVLINNTFANGVVLESIRAKYQMPIASYIHELHTMAKMHIDKTSVDNTIRYSDLFIVPSKAVSDFLASEWNIESSRIETLDYYIPVPAAPTSRSAGDILTIGGCGTTDWRKGYDLFVQTALFVKRHFPEIKCRFTWKGGSPDSIPLRHSKFEMQRAGYPDLVTFVEPGIEMASFYSGLDIFLLTSREDPNPLVVLGAASFGVPTVCFDNSGGAPGFVKPECGQAVPYVDVSEMSNAIMRYAANPGDIGRDGNNAYRKVVSQHSDQKRILRQIENIINKLKSNSQGR